MFQRTCGIGAKTIEIRIITLLDWRIDISILLIIDYNSVESDKID